MNGQDIHRARTEAKVSQGRLAKALELTHRGSLADVESGAIEITPAWALRALAAIQGLATQQTA